MGRLDRYVFRVFAATWLVVAAALLGLLTVFDLLGHGDELGEAPLQGGMLYAALARYVAYGVPFLLVQFAPYLSLLAGIATVLALAKGREWTPMVTAGRPALRAFAPLFLGAGLLALGVALVRERVLPACALQREALDKYLFAQRAWQLDDLWARGRDQTRLYAERFAPGGLPGARGPAPPPAIAGLEVYDTAPDGTFRSLTADAAVWRGGHWELENGVLHSEGAGAQPVTRFDHPDLGPDGLQLAYFSLVNPLFLSSGQFREVLRRDPEHRQAATLLWAWRLAPLAHALLLLLALPFVLSFERRSSLEGVAFGVLLGGLYFVTEILLQDLGARGVVPPLLGGAGASLLFGCLALAALGRLPT